MKTVTFHSFKGGTGKTSIAVNFAWYLSVSGYNTALIDFDLRAPSLYSYFPLESNAPITYFTDYILTSCQLKDIFYPIPIKKSVNSRFWVSYASFDFLKQESEQRRRLIQKDAMVLPKLFQIAKYLEQQDFDYLIIDNMPGVSYRALDALIVASHVACITRPSMSEVMGLEQLATNIYSRLSEDAQIGLVINQKEERNELQGKEVSHFLDLNKDLQRHEEIYTELQKVLERINATFEFQLIAHIPRIPFLVERIYVPNQIDDAMQDSRIRPFMEALELLKRWTEEG